MTFLNELFLQCSYGKQSKGGKGGFWEAFSSYAFMFIRRNNWEEEGGFWDDFFLQLGPTSPIKLLTIEKTIRPSFLERKKIGTMNCKF
jgi:hypothetical protein